MKSIDDATPEEWNKLNKKKSWVDHVIEQEDQHNNHPVFGENIPDNSTKFDSVSKPAHYNNGSME